jgi:hypothetical protein
VIDKKLHILLVLREVRVGVRATDFRRFRNVFKSTVELVKTDRLYAKSNSTIDIVKTGRL